MSSQPGSSTRAGTYEAPKYYQGKTHIMGDVRINRKLFTYRTEVGLVAGSAASVMFSVDHPVKEVWPYFKDFNLWQPKHYYSGVVGDMEGQAIANGDSPEQLATMSHLYHVVRVIPEYMIVLQQSVPRNASEHLDSGLPGIGGISGGFSVFTLHEHAGKTEVAIIMTHSSYAAREDEADDERALAKWRDQLMPEGLRKWRDEFIPQLRQAVSERRRTRA